MAFKIIKRIFKYSLGGMSVARAHKFVSEILNCLFVKSLVNMLNIVYHFKVCFCDKTGCKFIIIIIKSAPIEILVKVISKKDERLFKQTVFKNKR